MGVTGPCWSQVSIDLDNGLVPSGIKPLPEAMLIQVYVYGVNRSQYVYEIVVILLLLCYVVLFFCLFHLCDLFVIALCKTSNHIWYAVPASSFKIHI